MLLNDFARADLGRFLERNRFLEPRRRNHARSVLVLVAFGPFDGVSDTIDQPDVDFQPFGHFKLHRLIRHKFRFGRHDRFARRALRQFVDRSYPIGFVA